MLPLLPAAVVSPMHGETVYLVGLASGPPQPFGGRGPCPDDPHLAAPEDHQANEQLIFHGFGRSPRKSGVGLSLTKLPGAAIGDISPGQRAADVAHGTPDKTQRRKRSVL